MKKRLPDDQEFYRFLDGGAPVAPFPDVEEEDPDERRRQAEAWNAFLFHQHRRRVAADLRSLQERCPHTYAHLVTKPARPSFKECPDCGATWKVF